MAELQVGEGYVFQVASARAFRKWNSTAFLSSEWRSNLDKLLSVGWMHHLWVLAATGVNSGYNCRIITFHFDVLTSPFGTNTAASMAMGSNSLRVIWDPVRFPAHSGWN